MKQYIVPLLTLLFVFSYSNAMENNICYLNLMPLCALDRIAYFLKCDDETEEQFIERTQGYKQDSEYYADADSHDYGPKILCAFYEYEPDKFLYVNLTCLENDSHKHELSITKEDDNFDFDFYNGALELAEYQCIALFGKRMALFYHKKTENMMRPVLELQRINLKKNEDKYKGIIDLGEKRELSPLFFEPTWIGFNKQGTHLIVHGKECSTNHVTHKIFFLKNIDAHASQVVVKTTHKLQEYLRGKFVCNKFIEGTK